MKTDVIICGAGPTGLALACQFVRFGIDFVILDKKETITEFSKAIGVQARTLEIYEQIGLADDLVAQGNIAEKVRLVEGGEIRGELDLNTVGEGMSPYSFLLIVEQSKHENLLYDFLKSSGKDVLWETELENFSQDKTGVIANIKRTNGETEQIEAKFLVGADGAKSVVRHTLGMTFEGSTFERLFYVADVQIDWDFPHDALYVCLAESTVTAFFPLVGKKRYRIVGTFPENEERREGEILYDEIEKQIIKDTNLKLDISNVQWFSVYRVHSRRVNSFSNGRCFLAGDSAHIHTPAGGQGMNTGIQDGYNLAWKIAAVLKGKAKPELLETYNEERIEVAKQLLKTTDRLFDFAASEDSITSFIRLNIFPYIANLALKSEAVKNFIFPLISQIGINYRKSSLSVNDGIFKVKAGDRMPYFTVDGAEIYDKINAPKFHLVRFSDGTTKTPDYSKVLNVYGDFLDFHEFPLYPNIAEIFGINRTFAVILRPDNYIGLIAAENVEGNAVENYLVVI